jgi:alpha-maltose-1-phosphate synthase
VTSGQKIRVAAALVGDIVSEGGARTKYGPLMVALAKQVIVAAVVDGTLHGRDKLENAVCSFHPRRHRWRERFYKNPFAFHRRSERVVAHLQRLQPVPDAVLQVGVLFDAGWQGQGPPLIIYTDYTAALSAQKPEAGRSPLGAEAQRRWLELEQRAYEHAAHVCVRSALVKRSLLEDYALPAEKVTVVGGGVNFDPLPQVSPRSQGPPTALFIGKEFHRKGGDLLLEAFERVRRQQTNARLLLVSNAPFARDEAPPGVELIAPTWDRETIASLYRKADLLVLPSRLETWGDVLLEASAFGLPVVAAADDAMGEIVRHGETGLLFPPEDVDGLADALAQLFADEDARRRLGAEGRSRVEREFLWDYVAAQITECLVRAARSRL